MQGQNVTSDIGNSGDHSSDNRSVSHVGNGGAAAERQLTVTGESAALISMIERAARDPNVDIDKMERLFQMHASVEARRAKAEYIAAMSAMQPELPVIEKRGEIARKAKDASGTKQDAKPTKFAKWEDVVERINPVLAKHGFSLSFRIKQDQRIEVTAVLGHRGGHCEETSMTLPIDDSGAKNNMQGWGSSVSYGKRYTAFALLNIVARGEDDDAQTAGTVTITEAQKAELETLIARTRADLDWICGKYEIPDLSYMTQAQFAEAKAGLTARQRAMAGGAR